MHGLSWVVEGLVGVCQWPITPTHLPSLQQEGGGEGVKSIESLYTWATADLQGSVHQGTGPHWHFTGAWGA
jgi:hypothetical protein